MTDRSATENKANNILSKEIQSSSSHSIESFKCAVHTLYYSFQTFARKN